MNITRHEFLEYLGIKNSRKNIVQKQNSSKKPLIGQLIKQNILFKPENIQKNSVPIKPYLKKKLLNFSTLEHQPKQQKDNLFNSYFFSIKSQSSDQKHINETQSQQVRSQFYKKIQSGMKQVNLSQLVLQPDQSHSIFEGVQPQQRRSKNQNLSQAKFKKNNQHQSLIIKSSHQNADLQDRYKNDQLKIYLDCRLDEEIRNRNQSKQQELEKNFKIQMEKKNLTLFPDLEQKDINQLEMSDKLKYKLWNLQSRMRRLNKLNQKKDKYPFIQNKQNDHSVHDLFSNQDEGKIQSLKLRYKYNLQCELKKMRLKSLSQHNDYEQNDFLLIGIYNPKDQSL